MISMVEIVKAPVNSKNILILSVILKSIIIFFLLIGFTITIIDAIKDQSALIFTFFTIISNFFILISTIIFLVSDIGRYFHKDWYGSRLFFDMRFFALIAITMTGCLFDFILVPVGGTDLLNSLDSVSFHVIVPFFSMADFLVCNTVYKIRIKDILLSLIYPICYLAFIMTLSYSGVRWVDTMTQGVAYAPYPFLDYHANTWFGKGEYIGVFYWVIILLAAFLALGFAYRLCQYVIKRKHIHIFR